MASRKRKGPQTAYRRGRSFEYAVSKDARDDGWIVYRAAGSHGFADLVLLRAMKCAAPTAEVRLCQLKGNGRPPGPAEREGLIAEAKAAGAQPWAVIRPARGERKWILLR